jgi:hypothetical protein
MLNATSILPRWRFLMLRIFISVAGAWGRGTEFAASTSFALGLRQSYFQTDAMP